VIVQKMIFVPVVLGHQTDMSWNPLSNENGWGSDSMVSYARGLTHYELEEMEASVGRCHKLFKKKLPTFDTMYYLKIMNYGQLQRNYKCGYG
tara:strand:+ start:22 stop:297 length:276 start_codon:yes stop_codon:yes gene_type:complete